MSENKRYFWLQLHDDFFTSKRIKKLRKLSADFVIIYLKLQLLSLKNNGILEYAGLEKSFAEEMALEIDEDVDKIQVTLSYLQACGLLVTEDEKEFFLPYVEMCTGSETASAVRQRKCRANKGLMAIESTKSVTMSQDCHNVSQYGHGEIEIEKEIEKELEINIEKEINKDKEKKNKEKKITVFFENPELNSAFIEFINYRKAIKKPLTEKGKALNVNTLRKLASMELPFSHDVVLDEEKAIAIINQSIERGWSGLFELKEDFKSKQTKQQDARENRKAMMEAWANE